MTASNSTDQTYLVRTYVFGRRAKIYEVEAPNATMAMHYAQSMAAFDADASPSRVNVTNVRLKPLPDLACGSCGEREGSTYARRCCTADNMVEV